MSDGLDNLRKELKIMKNEKAKLKEVFEPILWKNIDHEIYRVYKFPKGKVKIKHPVLLHVSKSGGHRILDVKNVSHYIPFKWIEIRFETDDNIAWRF